MLTLPVCGKELAIAKREADQMGRLNNSIRNGGGNFAGFIGELAALRVLRYLGAVRSNTYQHDLSVGRWRLDVKTKERTCQPKLNYDGTVPMYQNQNCHGYIFASVEIVRGVPLSVSLCGWMPKAEFMHYSSLMEVGDIDPSNGFECKMDCRNIPYMKLRPMFDLECSLMLSKEIAGRVVRSGG